MLVAGLALNTTALAAPTRTSDVKTGELSAELKQNALKLLSEVARESGQFNVPENRIRTGTIIADLLWEHDERAARGIYQNVFVELQNLFGKINQPEEKEMSSAERSEHYYRREKLAGLRHDYVLTLAAHDPQAASAALDALKTKLLEEYDPLQPTELELKLASVIAKTDPNRAYALAKEQLAAEGIAYQFIETLKDLHGKNSRLAANLGGDVLAKIKTAKIRVPSTVESSAKVTTNTAGNSQPIELDFWQVATFINAATEMNRRAARDKEKKMLPLFSETEMREMVELIARAYLTERSPTTHSIGQVMPEILQYSPALVPRIRLKIGAKAARELDTVSEAAEYYQIARKEKSIEQLAEDASRAAPNIRDSRYVDVIEKALDKNEPEKAQMIAERIKDRKGYAFLFEKIRAALPLAKARRGDIAEVRKILAALKTDRERIATLTELAAALAAKGENETAKKLLDEALEMVMKNPINQAGLEAAGKIAAVYAVVAPEAGFMIAETGIEQMNRYINAAINLDEFYDFGSTESGELLYAAANRQALLHVPHSTALLKNLARTDFDRTVRLADKFERSDIRLLVRLRIVQALLDADATEKEKKMREKVETEDEYH